MFRRLLHIFIGLLIAGAAPVQCAHAAEPVSRVELPMLAHNGAVVVEVMLNGQGPFRFLLDTGGGMKASASPKIIEQLKAPQVGEVRATDPSGKNPVTMGLYRLDSLKLGTLEFSDIEAPSRDFSHARVNDIDGVLGFRLFRDYLLTLDYRNQKVIIEKGSLAADPDALKFNAPRGIPVLNMSIGGREIETHIDTGNQVAPFIVPTTFAETLPAKGERRVVGQAHTVNNTYEIKEMVLDGDVVLGKTVFASPTISYPTPAGHANIGTKAFAGKTITFDQQNGLVRISG